MKQCPKCDTYAMDFDEYFGRYRCFNARCGWMPPSAAERRLRLLEKGATPKEVARLDLEDISLNMSVMYDEVNDVLGFDFNADEMSFDCPSDDARILWNVGRSTGQLCGLTVCGAKEFGISEVRLDIVTRLGLAATGASGHLMPIAGKPTRSTIENIAVRLKGYRPTPEMDRAIGPTVKKAIEPFATRRT